MTFEEHLKEMMKDDEFRKGYDALQLEIYFNDTLMKYCSKYDMDADEVLMRAGIPQKDIDYYMETANIPNAEFISSGLMSMNNKIEFAS